MSELEEIREALGLTQEVFAPLIGANAHSTYHRWENSPTTRSGKNALERAKAYYRKKKGTDWAGPPKGETATRNDIVRLETSLGIHVSYWQKGEKEVLKSLEALGQRISVIEDRLGIQK